MVDDRMKTVSSWLSRIFGTPALRVGVLVFVGAFSAALRIRAGTVKAVLGEDHPILAQSIHPVGWASLMNVWVSLLCSFGHMYAWRCRQLFGSAVWEVT